MKKEFIFLGPPACGKGTQTDKLSKFLNLPHIDTGSLLRAEIAKETEEGIIAKSFIDKGQLVPINLVATIIGKKLANNDCNIDNLNQYFFMKIYSSNKCVNNKIIL